jgi:hypothetical protein
MVEDLRRDRDAWRNQGVEADVVALATRSTG